jgi:glycosyltransferase involved in cell wall biosynthesis
MARILVLTADAPYFPGKMGVDFFNLRHLAQTHHVGVIAPAYAELPRAGLDNLRQTVQATYFWPEAQSELLPEATPAQGLRLRRPLRLLPAAWRRRALELLLGLPSGDEAGLLKLAVLRNLAPYLVKALAEGPWDVLVIVQSDTRPWLSYLPPHLPLAVYFHDVRSDYLARRATFEDDPLRFEREARRAEDGERAIVAQADAVGFVSELDRRRAEARFGALRHAHVAPIPIDLDYYTPRPPERPSATRPCVLFTGLLLHPPNIDAALFFLREVWPLVRARHPRACFQVAGAMPSAELRAACAHTPGVELHADVPDIRPFFWDAAVYVVPMRFGGGVRQKVLEAWAMQVPVVLTRMAAEGSAARAGHNSFLVDDPGAMAAEIGRLIEEPERAAAIVRQAHDDVRASHGLASACASFEQLVSRASTDARRRAPRVLLDLAWLAPTDASQRARRARALVRALLRLERRPTLRLLAPHGTLRALRPPSGTAHWLALPSDGLRVRSARLRGALVGLLGSSLATHQPASLALRRLALLRWFDADLAHVFAPELSRDSELLPSVLAWDENACAWRSARSRLTLDIYDSEATRARLVDDTSDPRARVLPAPTTWSDDAWDRHARVWCEIYSEHVERLRGAWPRA